MSALACAGVGGIAGKHFGTAENTSAERDFPAARAGTRIAGSTMGAGGRTRRLLLSDHRDKRDRPGHVRDKTRRVPGQTGTLF